jgi:hypothetical protein
MAFESANIRPCNQYNFINFKNILICKLNKFIILSLLLLLTSQSPSNSTPIIFAFEALLDYNPNSPFSSNFVRGSYTFDSETPNTSIDGLTGFYVSNPGKSKVKIGNFNAKADTVEIRVIDGTPSSVLIDDYQVQTSGAKRKKIGEYYLDSFSIALRSTTSTTGIVGIDLPITPPDLSLFNINIFDLNIGAPNPVNNFTVRGKLTSLRLSDDDQDPIATALEINSNLAQSALPTEVSVAQATAVPEPPPWSLIIVGLALLVVRWFSYPIRTLT